MHTPTSSAFGRVLAKAHERIRKAAALLRARGRAPAVELPSTVGEAKKVATALEGEVEMTDSPRAPEPAATPHATHTQPSARSVPVPSTAAAGASTVLPVSTPVAGANPIASAQSNAPVAADHLQRLAVEPFGAILAIRDTAQRKSALADYVKERRVTATQAALLCDGDLVFLIESTRDHTERFEFYTLWSRRMRDRTR